MKNFLAPKSIAIIGASSKKGKVGNTLMNNLKNFKGKIYPINLKEKTILNKKAYPSVLSIKEKIDLAVIAIPAPFVYNAIKECGEKGIKSVIIISAGFSEIGKKREELILLDLAKTYNMRLLGANCFGTVNPYISLDTSFALTTPEPGPIAFISQSGALWSAIAEYSIGKFGFSAFISLGNTIDVSFPELIEYLNKDPKTKAIVCYIESLKKGKAFMKACKNSKKPVIVIKAGKTESGKKATISHTGSLAGEYEIYQAAFEQSNAKIANTLTEAFDKAFLLSNQRPKNKTIILTNAGGPGALTADYCDQNNLELVTLPKRFILSLKNLPKSWSHGNPMDLIGDANLERYKEALTKLKDKDFYDNLVIILTPQGMTDPEELANELINFKKESTKTVAVCFMGGSSIKKAAELLNKNNIPCFFEPERVVKSIS